jgi:hypothetical protein
MYCELKNKAYWVWSSRIASLDCIPQFKFKTLDELNLHYGALSTSRRVKKVKGKPSKTKKTYEKAESMKNQRLYSWAVNLN